jgi:heme A synthase
MQLLPFRFFRWCQDLWLARTIDAGQWNFAIIETVHIIAFTILLGTVFVVNLRLLGFGLRRQKVAAVARYLAPYTWGSLFMVAVTGILLFLTEAVKLGGSAAFLWKIDILAIALGTHLLVYKTIIANAAKEGSPWEKVGASLSLLTWFGVALAGRAIAFT